MEDNNHATQQRLNSTIARLLSQTEARVGMHLTMPYECDDAHVYLACVPCMCMFSFPRRKLEWVYTCIDVCAIDYASYELDDACVA